MSDAFPRLDVRIVALLLAAFLLALLTISAQLAKGRRYAAISIYSMIFVSEYVVGTFVATTNTLVVAHTQLTSDAVVQALTLALLGYAVLLVGYAIPGLLPRAVKEQPVVGEEPFPPAYRTALFVLLAVTLALGFVQLYLRVQKAGGFAAYLAIAYTMRLGTYAEGDVANAWAVLASLVAAGALPCAALLYVAWMRGRLSALEKWLLLGLTAVLLVRQASTAFRAVVVFTLISAFAVYDSERRVGWRTLVFTGVALLLILVGVNYVHVMLHTLTGFGQSTTFAEASQELLAPHGYLQTLSGLVDARERLTPLEGQGMLTSILYFIPRAIWTTKVPSGDYGTGLVQEWAGFPTGYQMAVTNVGELFVHFGRAGILALVLWGIAYRWLDDRWDVSVEWRVALLCITVPRVFPDQGMGLSALMISLTSIAGFIVPVIIARRMAGASGWHPPASV